MTQRERAAVHVEPLGIDRADRVLATQSRAGEGVAAQHLEDAQHLRRERLVHVHEVDRAQLEPRALQRLRHGERGPHQQLVCRIDTGVRPGAERRQRLETERLGLVLAHQQHRRGAVGERAGVARGERAVLREHRPELCQSLHRRVRAHQAVGVHPATVRRLHRYDLVVEAPRRDGLGRAVVRAHRELVLRLARDLVAPCHALGRFAHHLAGAALGDLRLPGQQVA